MASLWSYFLGETQIHARTPFVGIKDGARNWFNRSALSRFGLERFCDLTIKIQQITALSESEEIVQGDLWLASAHYSPAHVWLHVIRNVPGAGAGDLP